MAKKFKMFNENVEKAIYSDIGGVENALNTVRRKLAKKYNCTYRDITNAVYNQYLKLNGYTADEEGAEFLVKNNIGDTHIVNLTGITLSKIRTLRKKHGASVINEICEATNNETLPEEVIIEQTNATPKKVSVREKFESVVDNKYITIPKVGHMKKVGLCSDRHDMPVNTFIFQSPISNDLMFDYSKQEEIVSNWIDDNIFKIGDKYAQGIMCYTTGLNCLNASVAKICMSKHIGLTFMNYDKQTNLYIEQIMLPVDVHISPISNISKIYSYVNRYLDINVHSRLLEKMTEDKSVTEVYAIEVCTQTGSQTFKIQDTFLYAYISDMYKELYMMGERYKPSPKSKNKMFLVKYTLSDTTNVIATKEILAMFGCYNMQTV